MPARVLFFGAAADISGTRTLDIPIDDGVTADQFLRKMVERFPALASQKLHLSINQEYVTGEELIRDGDELAIFTAVSGG